MNTSEVKRFMTRREAESEARKYASHGAQVVVFGREYAIEIRDGYGVKFVRNGGWFE